MTATFETPAPEPPVTAAGGDGRGAAQGEGAASRPLSAMSRLIMERGAELRADRDWTFRLYELFARGGDDEQLTYMVVPGDPWSKSRPRFTRRGGTYQPRDDREAEQKLAGQMRAVREQPFTGNVMLACRFYRSNFQRIDADNLLKHVCDSANGLWWADDSQVTFVLAEVHHDRAHPRTVILAAHHESTLLRGSDLDRPCAHCETPFRPLAGRARLDGQRFCSQRCARTAAGFADLSVPVDCPGCGEPFRRKTSAQKHCSRECGRSTLRGKPKQRAVFPLCPQCSKPLTHGRGGRCRDCWRADPKGLSLPSSSTSESSS